MRALRPGQPQPFTTPASPYNIVSGPGGDLWVAVNPTLTSSAIDRIGLNGSVTSFPVPPGEVRFLHTGRFPDDRAGRQCLVRRPFINANPSSCGPTPAPARLFLET